MTRKRFTINQAVRFWDIDTMGHVNNEIYFTYMEEARKEFFGHIFNSFSTAPSFGIVTIPLTISS